MLLPDRMKRRAAHILKQAFGESPESAAPIFSTEVYTMTALKCDVIHCASNRDNCCCRPEIQVDGKHAQDCCETCCASFSAIRNEAPRNDAADYSCPNCRVPIGCTAENCRHNRDGHCSASEVHMRSREATTEAQTECATFSCHCR